MLLAGKSVFRPQEPQSITIEFSTDQDIESILAEIKRLPEVIGAERDLVFCFIRVSLTDDKEITGFAETLKEQYKLVSAYHDKEQPIKYEV